MSAFLLIIILLFFVDVGTGDKIADVHFPRNQIVNGERISTVVIAMHGKSCNLLREMRIMMCVV